MKTLRLPFLMKLLMMSSLSAPGAWAQSSIEVGELAAIEDEHMEAVVRQKYTEDALAVTALAGTIAWQGTRKRLQNYIKKSHGMKKLLGRAASGAGLTASFGVPAYIGLNLYRAYQSRLPSFEEESAQYKAIVGEGQGSH